MTTRRWILAAALATAAAFAACTLNPQPLPPGFQGDDGAGSSPDGSARPGDKDPDNDRSDAAAGLDSGDPHEPEPDAGDAGDAGDSGDAGDADSG